MVCSESRSTAAASASAASSATPSRVVISTTRFVEENGRHVARFLESTPIADQEPVASAKCRGDRDDQRDGEPQRVRTGDHQHGDDTLDHERGALSREKPAHQSCHGRDHSYDRQEECRAVRERLGTGAGALGLGHETHDAGERCLLAGAGDLDAEGAGGVHGAGDHRAVRSLPDRS